MLGSVWCDYRFTDCSDLYSPGRFFAVSTLKLMLAYLVLEFDLKPFPEDRQPEWIEFGGVSLLKDDTYVTMKKRARMATIDAKTT